MSLLALLLYIIIVVVLGYLAIWILGTLAPGHPPIIDAIIWILVVLIVIVVLAQAVGLGSGPMVPRIRG
jgi:hypothetical protein